MLILPVVVADSVMMEKLSIYLACRHVCFTTTKSCLYIIQQETRLVRFGGFYHQSNGKIYVYFCDVTCLKHQHMFFKIMLAFSFSKIYTFPIRHPDFHSFWTRVFYSVATCCIAHFIKKTTFVQPFITSKSCDFKVCGLSG